MRTFTAASLALLAALTFSQGVSAPAKPSDKAVVTKVASLIKDPAKLDGKLVKLSGTVARFEAKKSKSGNPYLVFRLSDGKDFVNVYSHGDAPSFLKDGAKATVEGIFRKEKVVSKGKPNEFKVKNEVDVSGGKGKAPKISKA
jgi:cytochrome c-type biogenesis protein CcmE